MAPLRPTVLLAGACLVGAIIDARVGQPDLNGYEEIQRPEKEKPVVANCPRETKAMPFSKHSTKQFNGTFIFSSFEGDVQAVYARMGLPMALRELARKFNYGVNICGERVTHSDNYMKVMSLIHINNGVYVMGTGDYIVGKGKATPFGYSICGNWIKNGTELLVRCKELPNSPYGGKMIFPVIRRYWKEDGKAQVVEASLDELVIPMTFTQKTKRNRGDTVDIPVPPIWTPDRPDQSTRSDDLGPVDSNSASMTKEEAISFAGMMSMGLLPPFMPMKIIDYAELVG